MPSENSGALQTPRPTLAIIPVHGSKVQGGVINFQVQRGVIKIFFREGSGGVRAKAGFGIYVIKKVREAHGKFCHIFKLHLVELTGNRLAREARRIFFLS